jgi:hypothetical protein
VLILAKKEVNHYREEQKYVDIQYFDDESHKKHNYVAGRRILGVDFVRIYKVLKILRKNNPEKSILQDTSFSELHW